MSDNARDRLAPADFTESTAHTIYLMQMSHRDMRIEALSASVATLRRELADCRRALLIASEMKDGTFLQRRNWENSVRDGKFYEAQLALVRAAASAPGVAREEE